MTFWVRQKFDSKTLVGLRKSFEFKKLLDLKKNMSEKNCWTKKIMGPIKCCVQNNLVGKLILVPKNVGPKNLGVKKFWVKKTLRPKKSFGSKKSLFYISYV